VVVRGNKPEILWHLDLYRLEHEQETEALGLDELWSHIVLIEWPKVAARFLPENTLDIAFEFGKSSETRMLTFSGNDAWRDRLAGLT
jgi:tRNA A37 threonylcarbamoyladenosine biosynthesis protein TsaE